MAGIDSIRRRIMRASVRRRTKAAYGGDVAEAVEHIRRAILQPQSTYTITIDDDATSGTVTLTTAQSGAWHCGHGRPGGYLCPHCMALA